MKVITFDIISFVFKRLGKTPVVPDQITCLLFSLLEDLTNFKIKIIYVCVYSTAVAYVEYSRFGID